MRFQLYSVALLFVLGTVAVVAGNHQLGGSRTKLPATAVIAAPQAALVASQGAQQQHEKPHHGMSMTT
jgi:catalase (peroxidase I)